MPLPEPLEPFRTTKYPKTAVTLLFTVIPRRAPCPSIIDVPFCVVKALFHPPERVMLVLSDTTSVPVPVYVPIATRTVSPAVKPTLLNAPLMVAQGLPTLEQEKPSLPPGATYHGPA